MNPPPSTGRSEERSTERNRTRPRKATLRCVDCGHGAAVGGDWIVREVASAGDCYHLACACPECGSILPEVVRVRRLSTATR